MDRKSSLIWRIAVALRPALLIAVASTLAVLVSKWFHADLGGLWIVLTAIVVIQASAPDSWQAAIDRVIGTVIGALTGAIAGALFYMSPFGVVAAVTLAALICCIPRLKKSQHLASLTALIVIMLPQGNSTITAVHRFLDTVAGIIIALVVSLLASVSDRWLQYDPRAEA